MMNPMDVKKKALQAVKVFGREGMGEHLKKGYGPEGKKPAIAISIESTKVEPEEEGEYENEGEHGGEHQMPDGSMMKDSAMAGGEYGGEGMKPEAKPEITPELLEMLLAKLGK